MRLTLAIATACLVGRVLGGSGTGLAGPGGKTVFEDVVATATAGAKTAEITAAAGTGVSRRKEGGDSLLRKRDVCARKCEWDGFCVEDKAKGFAGCCARE